MFITDISNDFESLNYITYLTISTCTVNIYANILFFVRKNALSILCYSRLIDELYKTNI